MYVTDIKLQKKNNKNFYTPFIIERLKPLYTSTSMDNFLYGKIPRLHSFQLIILTAFWNTMYTLDIV